MAVHHLRAAPETTRFGMLDAAFPAVLCVRSGDSVILESVSGFPEAMPRPDSGMVVPEALRAIHRANPPRLGPHIVTGPVDVEGADIGDMLEVRVDAIEFGADWGFCFVLPLRGTLPDDFPTADLSFIPLDAERRHCLLPWGPKIPLRPFFGVMGVAPPAGYGRVSTREPREFGGNIDNKELGAGSTLYLPVLAKGAKFYAGDGHGVQGDGEVCVTALEICLNGTFTLILHKGGGAQAPALRYPRAETPTHYISFGLGPDLDRAMERALREMIDFISVRTGCSRAQAYKVCSLAVDFRVTQTVNGEKGVHGMLAKGLLF